MFACKIGAKDFSKNENFNLVTLRYSGERIWHKLNNSWKDYLVLYAGGVSIVEEGGQLKRVELLESDPRIANKTCNYSYQHWSIFVVLLSLAWNCFGISSLNGAKVIIFLMFLFAVLNIVVSLGPFILL